MLPVAVVDTVPLVTDADGVIRIRNTRVTLDTIVTAFREGATAEEIIQQYPSLHLGDVYSVIGYYLHRQAEIDTYLDKRKQLAHEIRIKNENQFDPVGVRARLLSRTNRQG